MSKCIIKHNIININNEMTDINELSSELNNEKSLASNHYQQPQPQRYGQDVARPLYEVDIDFDEASRAWKSNKKPKGNGCYTYVCQGITKNNKKCIRNSLVGSQYCHLHKKFEALVSC